MEVSTSPALVGSIPAYQQEESTRNRRLIGFVVAVGATGLLGVAAWLTPASEGIGTHQQLMLPECGWISLMDMPCPTCGMTTAFSYAADGRLVMSFLTQPLGSLLAISTAMALLVGIYVAVTGSRVGSLLGRLWGRRSGWIIAVLIVVSWMYKALSHKGMI